MLIIIIIINIIIITQGLVKSVCVVNPLRQLLVNYYSSHSILWQYYTVIYTRPYGEYSGTALGGLVQRSQGAPIHSLALLWMVAALMHPLDKKYYSRVLFQNTKVLHKRCFRHQCTKLVGINQCFVKLSSFFFLIHKVDRSESKTRVRSRLSVNLALLGKIIKIRLLESVNQSWSFTHVIHFRLQLGCIFSLNH